MRRFRFKAVFLIVVCSFSAVMAQTPARTPKPPDPNDQYVPGPDSRPQTGVPEGRVIEFSMPRRSPKGQIRRPKSQSVPWTTKELVGKHIWWLYVPPGYDKKKPIPIMVFLDGSGFASKYGYRVPIVLNNLLAKKEIPMVAALFVETVQEFIYSPDGSPRGTTSNRAIAWNRDYTNFLVKEIFPTLRKYVTITDDPRGRVIVGGSAGGSLAFEVAYSSPDLFGNMVSFVGTFDELMTDMAGKKKTKPADLVRQSEKKPIRLFIQEGKGDFSYESTKELAAALTEKGYDFKLVIGEGTHNGNHGISIMPDVIRWLWRDYPKN